jgi:acetyl-CoA C-acetyltransferase
VKELQLESNWPIVIGAAQLSERDVTIETAMSPIEMLTRIVREAAESSGGDPMLVASIDTIGLADTLGWSAANPPRLLAEAIGAKPATEWLSHVGGESAVALTNNAAMRVAAGDSQLAFVGGCNNIRAIGLARKKGVRFDWPTGGSGSPTLVGKVGAGSSEAELAAGLDRPISVYPIFENALRVARGQSLDEHRRAMGALFEPFTRVAAANPYAWFPVERSAQELSTPTSGNRMICFPYPKYLNAVMATDQSAGVLIASQAMARRLGIPEENWIYWRGGALEVEDPWLLSLRPSYSESPALKTCHETAFANAGITLDEIDLIDFYSCFPSAVSMACEMLGLAEDDSRGLTLTGGLPYAGGPGNSYSFHALATAVTRLRKKTGENALVTGNGWYLTKHSATILSRQPPSAGDDPSAAPATDATRTKWTAPPVQLQTKANGAATVETYTIGHGRDGKPERGIIIGRLTETNERFLANTEPDADLLAELEKSELIGTEGSVDYKDGRNLYTPN